MGGVGEKIMVGALTGVMSPLLGKLTGVMGEEYAKLRGARKKLESLSKELIAINVMLEKYSSMESPDVQVKAWVKEVRELASDMEDRIDLFTYHVDRDPASDDDRAAATTTGGFKALLRKNIRKVKRLRRRHKFAGEIQALQILVNEVYERQLKYKLDGHGIPSAVPTEIDPRLPALYVEMEKLVGVEYPIEEIVGRFVAEEPTKQRRTVESVVADDRRKRRMVASVVGSGGSGKTTLAKEVYRKIKHEFGYTAFVSVSQKPNISNLLRILLSETGGVHGSSEQLRSYNDQQLIDRIREYLQDRRYLVVVDDIWSKSAWETIQCALPKNDHASRIIATTRINSIAQFCCTSDEGFVYPMKPLSRSDSRELFLMRMFDAEDKCPDQLEGIMNDILHKCDGLPLAIVTLGSLLANKPRIKEEWKRVLNSIRSIDGKDEELEVMDKILALSYSDLSHNLKTCLLYLSMFPEDYEIDKFQLVWRWIAEGFVVSKHGYTLEEVGESYFNELINRSMIQPVYKEDEYDSKVVACRVHDVILDFIISRSTHENFVSILDCKDIPSSHDKIRRLYIRKKNQRAGEMSQQTMNLSHLRSLNLFTDVTWVPPLLDLQVLRVLYLEGCSYLKDDHLENIGSLIHLRYLGLRKTKIKKLPVQIGKLEFLETLDLRTSQIRELPDAIVRLKRLRCLVGDGLRLPDGFGNMEGLCELWEIDGCNSSINFGKDLHNLMQLRVLRVAFRSYCDDWQIRKETFLCKLGENSLRSLHIYNSHDGVMCFTDSWCPPPVLLQKFVMEGRAGHFPTFPKWINPSLCELTYLDIVVTRMQGRALHMLEGLPALCVLCLTVGEIPREGLQVSRSGFRWLTYFLFDNMSGPGLTFEAGAMPKLQTLFLKFHADKAHSTYGGIGFGIRHLLSLNHIDVHINHGCFEVYTTASNSLRSVIFREARLLPNKPNMKLRVIDGHVNVD